MRSQIICNTMIKCETIFLCALFLLLYDVHHAASVTLAPGDIIVSDFNGAFGGPVASPPGGRILKIDPTTGEQTIITSGNLLNAPAPFGLTIDEDGQIIVVNQTSPSGGEIIKVDPVSGSQAIISSGGLFVLPHGIAIDTAGNILVADLSYNTTGAIIKVDPNTGEQTVIYSGGFLNYPRDLAIDAAGNIYVIFGSPVAALQVVKIDHNTGTQTLISSGTFLVWPGGLLIDNTGNIFVSEIYYYNGIIKVDPSTGVQTIFSSGYPFQDPWDLDSDVTGNLVAADSNWFWEGMILKVDSSSGVKTVLSSGNLLVDPAGIAVVRVPSKLTIVIDIKPGSNNNSINPKSKGKIPVAILTTDIFNVSSVDVTTVFFGLTGTEAPVVHSALNDVDDDGDTDIILKFNTQDTGITCGDTSALLKGNTVNGLKIEGTDTITTTGCKQNKKIKPFRKNHNFD